MRSQFNGMIAGLVEGMNSSSCVRPLTGKRSLSGGGITGRRPFPPLFGARIDDATPAGKTRPVTEWIYFLHPPRDDFAATMTAEEKAVWAEHFQRLQRLLASGQLILAGPTLGTVNTGLVVFEAADEQAARQVMQEDPVVRGGYARGEVRPFRVSLLRGRD
jgi:uncharacterized protein YciI